MPFGLSSDLLECFSILKKTFQETNQEDFFREVEGSTHHYQALPPPICVNLKSILIELVIDPIDL